MPAARLVSRDDSVLVVIDIQERLAAAMEHRARIAAATEKLVRTAALLRWPILVTRQNPAGLGDVVPELRELFASPGIAPLVRVIDKMSFCCHGERSFADALALTGRSQLVLCGMETHVCVSQTALVLYGEGRGVYVAADACCSQRDYDAKIALQRLRREGVVVATSEALMYEAVGCAGTDEFRALLRVVKGEEAG